MSSILSRRRARALLVATLLATEAIAAPAPLLHAMFQDHAVLQRERPIAVWGDAAPGDTITLTLAGNTVASRADAAGHWEASLPALPAGGPHVLTARAGSGATQSANDVLVGDVFLCSGQSNMGLQVNRALNSYNEIANSANDAIRLMNVGQAINTAPQRDFAAPVQWQVAGPGTVGDFSAACFYFGRELQKSLRIPIGLINSSWGGSKIEAWMSDAALRRVDGYEPKLDVLRTYRTDPTSGGEQWGAMWESWWHGQPPTHAIADPWRPGPLGQEWRPAPAGLGAWEKWGVSELESYNGMVWYRTTVKLTAKQAKQRAQLAIGQVDEVDQTWVNGRPVGNTRGFGGDPHADDLPNGVFEANRQRVGSARVYYLPTGSLKAGENLIVVNVLDTWGSGGLYGSAEQRALMLADGTVIPLNDAWHYQIAPRGMGSVPRAPWEAVAGLTTIRNAMIAPLGNFGIRGVAWYQGESNTDQAERYQALLQSFMADWRQQFGADLPFLIVQLANYGPAPIAPAESGWAKLRDAQRLAVLADGNAGLAVAVDIGDRYDIHPANKQEVGRRLARAAQHVIYGDTAPPSGPMAVAAHEQDARVAVTFADVTGRLVAYSAAGPSGFELCGAEPNSCRFVSAVIDGNRVLLDASGVSSPTRVRYCWADSPVCNLYDETTLPASPFELKVASAASAH